MGGSSKPFNVRFNPRKEAHKVKLDHMLGFGTEVVQEAKGDASKQGTTDRLNQLLRKLQELNQRVDALQRRY